MQQTTSSQEPVGLRELYDAIADAQASYSRIKPPGTQQPAIDWITISLARFESTDAAIAVLPDINADGMASLRDFWPTVDLTETVLPTALDTASRSLFSGTISKPEESMFSAWMALQVNDIVGLLGGYSSWAPTVLEIAYLGDIVSSLAAADEGGDLSAILPPGELLVGGLELKS